nr:hypothetical protein [Tanacetum cinerariifolium]
MVYIGDDGQAFFTSHAWRRLFEVRGPLLDRVRRRMTWRQFILALGLHIEEEMVEARGQAPEKVTDIDLFYLRSMDRWTANVPYLSAQFLFSHADGRKVRPCFQEIDLHELGRLNICLRVSNTWAWVSQGPKRQQAIVAGAPGVAKDAPIADEGAQTRFSTWMISCITQIMDAGGCTYEEFDSTLVGSSRVSYQRLVRPKTGDANTPQLPTHMTNDP